VDSIIEKPKTRIRETYKETARTYYDIAKVQKTSLVLTNYLRKLDVHKVRDDGSLVKSLTHLRVVIDDTLTRLKTR